MGKPTARQQTAAWFPVAVAALIIAAPAAGPAPVTAAPGARGLGASGEPQATAAPGRPRVIVTSDGEIDDQCSLVRFLLYANEWDTEAIITSAARSRDPDGDHLTYHWWRDREAGSYQGAVQIRDALQQTASLAIPPDAVEGQSIHLVCEVSDSGTPRLTRYERVIVSVTP